MSRYSKLITDNYIYFYHLDKFCIIPVYPDQITDQMSSTFMPTNSLARTAPVFTYQYSGPRTVSITFSLHRDLMNDVNIDISNLKDNVVDFSEEDYIDTLVKYLQSVALPKYNAYSSGSKTVEPPMVAVRFGNDIFIKGVVTSAIQCTYKKPIMTNGKYACVDISFTVSETDPYDAETIVNEGSFRGISKTFKDGVYRTTTSSVKKTTNTKNVSNNASDNYVLNTYDVKYMKVDKLTASAAVNEFVNKNS